MHSLNWIELQPEPATAYRVSCPLASKKLMSQLFSVAIDLILFKLVGNEDKQFRPDWTTDKELHVAVALDNGFLSLELFKIF